MAEVEVEAYWGWLALEAASAPIELRLEALEHYEEATGRPAHEARATLLYLGGDALRASDLFTRAYEDFGSVRLRNHALAALAASVQHD